MQTSLDSYIQSAIHGSDIYYRYLTEHQRGLVENKVEKVRQKGKYIVLSLKSILRFPDGTQIKIENRIYTAEQIKPIEYNEKTKELTVRALEPFHQELLNTPLDNIMVISDLRFLVKRIENWYHRHGAKIQLPPKIKRAVSVPSFRSGEKPSDEQKKAICSALSHSFSYIWGAPGTGKTQFVLAHCILAYARKKKRVLIAAPTNNAIEQVLRGVLPVLETAGISRTNVLRLGMPSQRFRSDYPEICEDAEIAKNHAQIDDEISQLFSQITEKQKQMERFDAYQKMLEFEQSQIRWEAKMPTLLQQITSLQQNYRTLENEYLEFEGRQLTAEAKQSQLQKDEREQQANVIRLTKQSEYYKSSWRKLFCKQQYQNTLQLLHQEIQQLDKLRETIRQVDTNLSVYIQKKIELKQKQEDCNQQFIEIRNEIQQLTNYWLHLTTASKQLNKHILDVKNFDNLRIQTERARKLLENRRTKYLHFESLSIETLLAERASLEERYAAAQEQKKQIEAISQPRNRLVLAATVDTCLQQLSPDDSCLPSHIFLDEAGYCSMIKGAALLAYHCPITFLGDHMQLPPVCEMSDSQIELPESSDVCLWAQSALYIEDIFSKRPDQIWQTYIQHQPACFEQMIRFDLTHTYRFGENLANVLAQFIYSSSFHGNPQHSTEIYFLHATKQKQSEKKRTNPAECKAIISYIRMHPDEQIGIITPYKNQRDAILKALPRTIGRDDNVLTVHGSQGREWDTVLLSVVDTKDKWFTDSERLETNGRKLINTAVSRAKKKLILVCDTVYWKDQSSQLISHLLDVATCYPSR